MYGCPYIERVEGCPFLKYSALSFEDKVNKIDSLVEIDKEVLLELHLLCLNERNKIEKKKFFKH